jgi:hypothetical protein
MRDIKMTSDKVTAGEDYASIAFISQKLQLPERS